MLAILSQIRHTWARPGKLTAGSLAVFISLLNVPSALARTWLVRPDGPGDAPTIQAAIDSAAAADTVLIFPGTYNETLAIAGKPGLVVRGFAASLTILDALQQDRVIWMDGGTISGLTIRNGLTLTEGAGVHIAAQNPAVLRDCVIEGNVCTGGDLGYGGGVYVGGDPEAIRTIVIQANIIRGNGARWGSAVYCYDATCHIVANEMRENNGTNVITMCKGEVEGNLIVAHVLDIGPVVRSGCFGRGSNVIRGNTIADNIVFQGGSILGLGIDAEGNPLIERNTLAWNRQTLTGARPAIRCGPGSTLQCNVLWQNTLDVATCDTSVTGTLIADPLFCDRASGDYYVRRDSPCVQSRLACNYQLIGARPANCDPVAIRITSWSGIKLLFR